MVARAGRATATAVGDLLFSRAFAELAGVASPTTAAGSRCSPATSVGLARGELAQRRDAFDITISAERYLERCRLKTAQLFECACLIGAEPEPDEAEALRLYGREIGLAFQLLDDVLDVTGPPERTGKALGTDLLDGTVTMPLILARERDPGLAELDLRALDQAGGRGGCERIAATGVLDAVRADARARVVEAKEALATRAGQGQRRELLTMVADGVVERYAVGR